MENRMPDFLFRGGLSDIDPPAWELAELEAERQARRIILIPSESSAPPAVREALASTFQNIYAEGYPDEDTRRMSEAEILDYETRLPTYRRYSDPRYYKGVEYADAVEALARRRAADVFAANGVRPEDLFVNVQPLSGAPANNAVYAALLQPGDVLLGMDLSHGGHLTHGSPANRSGKIYRPVAYGIDLATGRIDYDAIEALARQHRPKIIVAGYSSYPWTVDWPRFRAIADAVGAYLMADIAHLAGLVAARVIPSPVGVADVITFTTHKSLCGPRGAAILTASPRLGRLIDRAVFPGEQGGPHVNTMLAQAVAFRLAASDSFRRLQTQIVANCVALTRALERGGFRLPYHGTDTHLTVIDVRTQTGPDGTSLSGDQAARILDLAGLVVNRNTIPGDRSPALASGVRMGTPWISQRGFTESDCEEIAGWIGALLRSSIPYSQEGRKGLQVRAKVDFHVLNEIRIQVRNKAEARGGEGGERRGYPHFSYLDDPVPPGAFAEIEIRGAAADGFVGWATSARPEDIASGAAVSAQLTAAGKTIEVGIARSKDEESWLVTVPTVEAALVATWLRDLSDGFVAFDQDVHRKLPGPVTVRVRAASAVAVSGPLHQGVDKPWFIAVPAGEEAPLVEFAWQEAEPDPLRRTTLFEAHRRMGAKMVPFAGWEMPVWYSSVIEEHMATRKAAGLFDVSHMGVYQVEGDQAQAFLDSVVGNDVSSLAVGESHYTQFLDPNGGVIDDAMVYRRAQDIYLVVVNASNDDKDWAWLEGVRGGAVRVDGRRPWSRAFGRGCRLRNLRSPDEGQDQRVDIALQGPKSRDILLSLGSDPATATRLKSLPWAGVMEAKLDSFDLVVSRTGYTGERVAFELFVHPDRAVDLWRALVKAGEPFGLRPAGLAARDSLRTEAGLPLYGHEMAGPFQLGVGDAGFAGYVKTHKPWFVGREGFLSQEASRQREVVRFRFEEKGVRMAHPGDPVVDNRGKVIGWVTSCAVDSEGFLLGQACLAADAQAEGTGIGVFQGAASVAGTAPATRPMTPAAARPGDRLPVPTPARVLSRFPK
jgi:glycine hydroxymethyltransferase